MVVCYFGLLGFSGKHVFFVLGLIRRSLREGGGFKGGRWDCCEGLVFSFLTGPFCQQGLGFRVQGLGLRVFGV